MTDDELNELIERLRGYRACKSWFELYLLITQAADLIASQAERLQQAEEVRYEVIPELPRLTDGIILAAARGHYGADRVARNGGPAGISMTVDGQDYAFDQAFRRMWTAIRAHLRKVDAEAVAARPAQHHADIARNQFTTGDLYTAGCTIANAIERTGQL